MRPTFCASGRPWRRAPSRQASAGPSARSRCAHGPADVSGNDLGSVRARGLLDISCDRRDRCYAQARPVGRPARTPRDDATEARPVRAPLTTGGFTHETTTIRSRSARRSRVRRACSARPRSAAAAATGGSGPYPADWSTSSSLPNHTIYRPNTLPSQRLPIVAWSNGACSADGTRAANFLREIASHGFLVISNGNPGGSGSSTSSWLTQSIDWAVAENSRPRAPCTTASTRARSASPAGRAAGWRPTRSPATRASPRPGSSAAACSTTPTTTSCRRLDHPIAYIIGGPSDIAYPNAIDDWGKLPSGLPAFMGNLNVGHGGTYGRPTVASSAGPRSCGSGGSSRATRPPARHSSAPAAGSAARRGRSSRRTSRSGRTRRRRPRRPRTVRSTRTPGTRW